VHHENDVIDRHGLSNHAVDMEIRQIFWRAGDDHDWNIPAEHLRRKILSNRHAVHVRQAQVEHYQIGRGGLDELQRLEAVASLHDIEPFEPERGSPHRPERFVVFDKQDDRLLGHVNFRIFQNRSARFRASWTPIGMERITSRRYVATLPSKPAGFRINCRRLHKAQPRGFSTLKFLHPGMPAARSDVTRRFSRDFKESCRGDRPFL
jgi:hypothetical protein